ncbi:hypothetical protein [Nocardia rhizosphaerihabitans]|uniref:DUF5709 domain-containing protein n=1 Tax=Nocardia rhizosphaerihabitans TaxID=1691570 RepID=A0ABQ2K9D4_9NOCA|nr:hypothetical protein [Nocardia rhizosphaerihabitans]GGN74528.1 hypothetical protein GCM10011610_18170 [Nocardia rhizosphaerihabitans]
MSREPLDMDMGDDDQADDIVEYERYVEDPPEDYVIRNHEADADGFLGINEEVGEEWTENGAARQAVEEDERPAEVSAVRIVGDDGVDGDLYDDAINGEEGVERDLEGDENLTAGEYLADELDL